MVKLFANSGDPDQTPHSAASDLGLHCLPITHLWVSRLQWVKLCSVSRHVFIDDIYKFTLYIETDRPEHTKSGYQVNSFPIS